MKNLILILFFLLIFVLFYFIISLFGLFFYLSYSDIIENKEWLIIYTFFFGWWIAAICTDELSDNLN